MTSQTTVRLFVVFNLCGLFCEICSVILITWRQHVPSYVTEWFILQYFHSFLSFLICSSFPPEDEEPREEEAMTVEKRFLGIVQSMALTQLETAALRLAIARSDSGITSAIENFRRNLNEAELKRVLKEVANRVMQGALEDVQEGDEEDEEDSEEEEEEDREEDGEESQQEEDGQEQERDDESDEGSEVT